MYRKPREKDEPEVANIDEAKALANVPAAANDGLAEFPASRCHPRGTRLRDARGGNVLENSLHLLGEDVRVGVTVDLPRDKRQGGEAVLDLGEDLGVVEGGALERELLRGVGWSHELEAESEVADCGVVVVPGHSEDEPIVDV